MHTPHGKIKIFAANANKDLAASIARNLGLPLGESSVTRFSDGEINMRVNETVRGADVFIVQSTSPPVNDHLMELLIMLDAMRRSSAERLTAVIPYYGYARQDRKAKSHDPITAKLVADLLTQAGANRILTMDLHSPQIQGFFNIPLDHIKGVYQFAEYFKQGLGDLSDVVVVAPDVGSVKRSNGLAKLLGSNVPLAIVDKSRPRDNVSEVEHFIGNVKGKIAILMDDMLTSGGSLCNAAATVKEQGAEAVYACVTHPVFAPGAAQLIEDSVLEEIVVLDTISIKPDVPHERVFAGLTVNTDITALPNLRKPASERTGPKIKVLSVADIFSKAIGCIHEGTSIGKLFSMTLPS